MCLGNCFNFKRSAVNVLPLDAMVLLSLSSLVCMASFFYGHCTFQSVPPPLATGVDFFFSAPKGAITSEIKHAIKLAIKLKT